MKRIHLSGVVLAVWVSSQLVVIESAAVADGTLNVGKADANASPILPVNVADKIAFSRSTGST